MYSNYNIPNYRNNMQIRPNRNERFGGFVGPLLIGGLAGYAIGNNNVNNNSGIIYPIYPYPTYYYPNYPYSSTSNYYYY